MRLIEDKALYASDMTGSRADGRKYFGITLRPDTLLGAHLHSSEGRMWTVRRHTKLNHVVEDAYSLFVLPADRRREITMAII